MPTRPWNKPRTVAPAPKATLTPNAPPALPAREINNPIDRLAALRAQIAKLQKDEKDLTEVVRKLGDGEHDGDRVKAVITTTNPERLDTKAIKAAMPEDWVKRFTTSSPQTTVRFQPLL
jgi:hypothetical protein